MCIRDSELGERMKPDYLTSQFPAFIQRHGMKKMRFHDLRHSCASLLLANGVPLKQIQDWLGHSDFSTTANIYAHLDYSSKLSSAQAMVSGMPLPEAGDFGSKWEKKMCIRDRYRLLQYCDRRYFLCQYRRLRLN